MSQVDLATRGQSGRLVLRSPPNSFKLQNSRPLPTDGKVRATDQNYPRAYPLIHADPKRPIQIEGGADERPVRERLREVPQSLDAVAGLLSVSPDYSRFA